MTRNKVQIRFPRRHSVYININIDWPTLLLLEDGKENVGMMNLSMTHSMYTWSACMAEEAHVTTMGRVYNDSKRWRSHDADVKVFAHIGHDPDLQ